MRKIKFRAWDKKDKRMKVVTWIELRNTGRGRVKMIGGLHNKAYMDNVVLMQHTGLKDKKGKEIYEGDIVKSRIMLDYDVFAEPNIIEVEFENGGFSPMIDKKMTQYRVLPRYYDHEVIGNIYENPEMMYSKNT